MTLTTNSIYYGSVPTPPEQLSLRAGPLKLIFENGDLRNIRLGSVEVINRIYVAIRDKNWDTILPKLDNLNIDQQADCFEITFDVKHQKSDIDFRWQGHISGKTTGKIVFSMKGTAHSSFLKNRIGFCILHGRNCAGAPCRITHPDGQLLTGHFPKYIQPDQPFKSIQSIAHQVHEDLWATLKFSGDMFEMEDQRNWTDGSFKTYCTPLELPFPICINEGGTVEQSVILSLSGNVPVYESKIDPTTVCSITLTEKPSAQLPAFGVANASHLMPLALAEIDALKALYLDHLRVEVFFHKNAWLDPLLSAIKNGKELNLPLEVALSFDLNHQSELTQFFEQLREYKTSVARILVVNDRNPELATKRLDLLKPYLASEYRGVKIGIGSDANFAELNRSRPPTDGFDFLFYSINPQVHAYDNQSLIETLPVQADTVKSAAQFSNGLPIVVSSVTLKQRFNPVATGDVETVSKHDELPSQVDLRQKSLFAVGWTLGSISRLANAGVQSVTHFETTGWRGLMETKTGSPLPKLFPSKPGETFPLYRLFAAIGEFTNSKLRIIEISPSHTITAMACESDSGLHLLLANLTDQPQTVELHNFPQYFRVRSLDKTNYEEPVSLPVPLRRAKVDLLDQVSSIEPLTLLPYSFVQLDSI